MWRNTKPTTNYTTAVPFCFATSETTGKISSRKKLSLSLPSSSASSPSLAPSIHYRPPPPPAKEERGTELAMYSSIHFSTTVLYTFPPIGSILTDHSDRKNIADRPTAAQTLFCTVRQGESHLLFFSIQAPLFLPSPSGPSQMDTATAAPSLLVVCTHNNSIRSFKGTDQEDESGPFCGDSLHGGRGGGGKDEG